MEIAPLDKRCSRNTRAHRVRLTDALQQPPTLRNSVKMGLTGDRAAYPAAIVQANGTVEAELLDFVWYSYGRLWGSALCNLSTVSANRVFASGNVWKLCCFFNPSTARKAQRQKLWIYLPAEVELTLAFKAKNWVRNRAFLSRTWRLVVPRCEARTLLKFAYFLICRDLFRIVHTCSSLSRTL